MHIFLQVLEDFTKICIWSTSDLDLNTTVAMMVFQLELEWLLPSQNALLQKSQSSTEGGYVLLYYVGSNVHGKTVVHLEVQAELHTDDS